MFNKVRRTKTIFFKDSSKNVQPSTQCTRKPVHLTTRTFGIAAVQNRKKENYEQVGRPSKRQHREDGIELEKILCIETKKKN